MKINDLKVQKSRSKNRVGRGIAAGQGKTAGRGTKGQGSRAGKGRRPGFEGGQNPFMQRVPKLRGFRSFKVARENVYTGELGAIKGIVDNFSLYEAGLVKSPYSQVKLIIRGELTAKVSVKLQGASLAAIEAIQSKGGTFEVIEQNMRAAKQQTEK